MLKVYTKPGEGSIKKCPACGGWKGILTFRLVSGKVADKCKHCREHKK